MFSKSSANDLQKIEGNIFAANSMQPLQFALITDLQNPLSNSISDQDGNFKITFKGDSASLLISCLGYQSVNLKAYSGKKITVFLQPGIINLKEVLVLQSKAGSNFSSLAKIDLEIKPVNNAQELLRAVPGLFIAQHAGGGKAEQIFLRGFDSDHGTDVRVSMDGMPVNMVSHAHGQGYVDAHFIIPETINYIDFGAGPYYATQGNLNTAGYVSFNSFKSIEKSRLQLEAGRFNSFRALAIIDILKKDKDKQTAYIAADYVTTNGATDVSQHFIRNNIFAKYNHKISTQTNLSFSVSSFFSKWNASGQIPERAVKNNSISRFGSIDPSEGGNTSRVNINLLLLHQFKNGWKLENQAYYSFYAFNLFSNFTFFLKDTVNGDAINQAEQRNIIGYQSTLKQQFQFKEISIKSNYGAGFRNDVVRNSRLSHVIKRQFLNDVQLGNINELNAFGFMQQQVSKGKWMLDAGIRFDYLHFNYFNQLSVFQNPSQDKTIISPKLNIQYSLNPQLIIYIKAGKAFHSNDARVVVSNNGNQILPAAYGSDLGFIVKPTPNLFLNLAVWQLNLDQEFVYVGDEGVTEPSGKTSRQGIDVIARYQFYKKFYANLNFNITKPRFDGLEKGNNFIPLAPTVTSTGGIFYKPQNGINGSISYRLLKDRPATEDNAIVAKGYFLLDAALNYTQPKFEIGLAFENILNTEWNEAQFATTTRLKNEIAPVTEIHFTPGTPLFARLKIAVFF